MAICKGHGDLLAGGAGQGVYLHQFSRLHAYLMHFQRCNREQSPFSTAVCLLPCGFSFPRQLAHEELGIGGIIWWMLGSLKMWLTCYLSPCLAKKSEGTLFVFKQVTVMMYPQAPHPTLFPRLLCFWLLPGCMLGTLNLAHPLY